MTKKKEMSVQEILDEGKKEKELPVDENRFLKYVDPSNKETEALKKEIDNEMEIERQRYKVQYPQASPQDLKDLDKRLESDFESKASRLILWKGLNKADKTVTRDMVADMPRSLTSGIELSLIQTQLGNIDEEKLGKLKALRALTKGS